MKNSLATHDLWKNPGKRNKFAQWQPEGRLEVVCWTAPRPRESSDEGQQFALTFLGLPCRSHRNPTRIYLHIYILLLLCTHGTLIFCKQKLDDTRCVSKNIMANNTKQGLLWTPIDHLCYLPFSPHRHPEPTFTFEPASCEERVNGTLAEDDRGNPMIFL